MRTGGVWSVEYLDQMYVVDQVCVGWDYFEKSSGPISEFCWDLEDGMLSLRHRRDSYVPCSDCLVYPNFEADWLVGEARRVEYLPVFKGCSVVHQHRTAFLRIRASVPVA